jgi:hypothetical protein
MSLLKSCWFPGIPSPSQQCSHLLAASGSRTRLRKTTRSACIRPAHRVTLALQGRTALPLAWCQIPLPSDLSPAVRCLLLPGTTSPRHDGRCSTHAPTPSLHPPPLHLPSPPLSGPPPIASLRSTAAPLPRPRADPHRHRSSRNRPRLLPAHLPLLCTPSALVPRPYARAAPIRPPLFGRRRMCLPRAMRPLRSRPRQKHQSRQLTQPRTHPFLRLRQVRRSRRRLYLFVCARPRCPPLRRGAFEVRGPHRSHHSLCRRPQTSRPVNRPWRRPCARNAQHPHA